jgi:hypothetical protein
MNSIEKNAGDQLDGKARRYAQQHACSYRDALYAVVRNDDGLNRRYVYGENETVRSAPLTAAGKEMASLVADPGRVMVLAGFAIDRLVQAKMRNKRTDDPVSEYRGALASCRQEYPALARAAADGFLSDSDFATLALLIPSLAGEVEKGRFAQCVLDARFHGDALDQIRCYYD